MITVVVCHLQHIIVYTMNIRILCCYPKTTKINSMAERYSTSCAINIIFFNIAHNCTHRNFLWYSFFPYNCMITWFNQFGCTLYNALVLYGLVFEKLKSFFEDIFTKCFFIHFEFYDVLLYSKKTILFGIIYSFQVYIQWGRTTTKYQAF